MNFRRFTAALFCVALSLSVAPVCAQTPVPAASETPQPTAAPPIVLPDVPANQAAHNFFKAVMDKDYALGWALLTKKSQDGFIKAVAAKAQVDEPSVAAMFADTSGQVSRGFWDSLRDAIGEKTLKLALASPARTATETDTAASVIFTQAPVPMKMFKENGRWKFGYVETFFPKGIPKL